jgi:hypothetical protein
VVWKHLEREQQSVINFHFKTFEIASPVNVLTRFLGFLKGQRAPDSNTRRTELAGSAIVPFSTSGRSEPPLSFTNIREDLGLNAFRATA